LTPELYLRRPPAAHPEWRLDRLLKRKAEQGVKIYVIVYKEVTQTMSMSSSYTKVSVLHPRSYVMLSFVARPRGSASEHCLHAASRPHRIQRSGRLPVSGIRTSPSCRLQTTLSTGLIMKRSLWSIITTRALVVSISASVVGTPIITRYLTSTHLTSLRRSSRAKTTTMHESWTSMRSGTTLVTQFQSSRPLACHGTM
jgi:hypothetical protein